MTERLYYANAYLREFDATIARVERREGHAFVTLDRTLFYPTSGGQPFDVGTLDRERILDVVDEEDGSITHVIDESNSPTGLFRSGQVVRGTIDWGRRFDHMQQHTGQHALSAAFDRLFGARTVSFHLGSISSTIDLARELTAQQVAAAEDEVNRVVWEDHPVTIRYASAEEAAGLGLRKESKREGELRLIEIEGFDLSACGGTHVASTGAIGTVVIGSWERFKGGMRVEFLCGHRALDRFRRLRETLGSVVRLLSVTPEEVPQSVERLQADSKEQAKARAALQQDLARYRAEELAARAEATDRGLVILRAVEADAAELKGLAAAITSHPGRAVVLVSTTKPALVVVARSADLTVASNSVLSALIAAFGGRGGGRPEMAQGGGLDAPAAEILDAARAALVTTSETGRA